MKITYLKPSQATFSALAYQQLAELFGAPGINQAEEVLARLNEDILPITLAHKGYAAIAMETKVRGRIDRSMESFVRLLSEFDEVRECPITVIGALAMPLSFVLMARPGVHLSDLKLVLMHEQSLAACRETVRAMHVEVEDSSSNGQAAEDVACNPSFAKAAALGPRIAAEKYGLEVIREGLEDEPAVTTFFLLGPKSHLVHPVEMNRSLLVFRVRHVPGALVSVLGRFAAWGLNLRQIHSVSTGEGQYDFAIEIEVGALELRRHDQAIAEASDYIDSYILFGSFPVL